MERGTRLFGTHIEFQDRQKMSSTSDVPLPRGGVDFPASWRLQQPGVFCLNMFSMCTYMAITKLRLNSDSWLQHSLGPGCTLLSVGWAWQGWHHSSLHGEQVEGSLIMCVLCNVIFAPGQTRVCCNMAWHCKNGCCPCLGQLQSEVRRYLERLKY